MKLSDQELVVLKAIGHGVREIAQVIRAVGYPKATVKKILIELNRKGVISLYRHDYPSSLKPEQRKLMVRIGRDYYGAVSVRERNPMGKSKSALRTTGRALKSAAKSILASGSEILGAGAMALNPVRRKIRNKYIDLVIKGQAKKTPDGWRVGKKTFAQGRGTVNVSSGYYLDRHTGMVYAKRERNKTKKRAARRKRNIGEDFYDASGVFHPIRASADYSPTAAGETGRAAKRSRSKKRIAAKRKAASTARRRSVVKSRKKTTSRLASRSLKKSSGLLKGKRRNPSVATLKKRYRAALQAMDKAQSIMDRFALGTGKVTAAQYHAASRKSVVASRLAAKLDEQIRQATGTRAIYTEGLRRNPSATSIRKKFAGSVNGSRDLYFPQGTPSGQLAKLGKLVLIETEKGTIKPIHGTAWLCADTKERLHIGSTTNAPLFSGPARSFGKVTKVEYESSKPHLGYKGPIIWFHHMGERGGTRPTLHADGKGGLKFKGGNYKLTTRGIEH